MKEHVEERYEVRLIAKDIALLDDAAMKKLELGFREYLKKQKIRIWGRALVEALPRLDSVEGNLVRVIVFTDPNDSASLMCAAAELYPDGEMLLLRGGIELMSSWNELELDPEVG
jgi:hypothetical protein